MPKKTSIFNIFDFRGGYATDLPPQLMAENEMLKAENCWWTDSLEKRNGRSVYTSLTATGCGGDVVYMNDAWRRIVAEDTGSSVVFFEGSGTSFASINRAGGSSYAFTTGHKVKMDHLGNKVLAVNGHDRPAIIWASGGSIYANDLEQYDERVRDPDNWYAGFYASSTYTDDTADAQSASATDFALATTTATSGFYVACDFTFSKLVFTGCDAITGSFTATYQYFDGATWTSIGTLNATPDWTASGNHTLEFEIPMDSTGAVLWNKYSESEGNLTDRYVMRTLFAAQTNSPTCGKIDVSHTHYLSQIMADQRPQCVYVHKTTPFLAAGNQLQIGIYNDVTGWRSDRWEYFEEGGREIVDLVTHGDYLAIIKEAKLFALDGTSWQNWTTRPLKCAGGGVSPGGAISAGNRLWHVGKDGIYMWDDTSRLVVSKHINADVSGYTLTNAKMVFYDKYVWVAFPDDNVVLVFDPDTFRLDPMGDGRVSFFKFPSYPVSQFLYREDADNDGYLMALVDKYIYQLDTGTVDMLSTTATITMDFQSKMYAGGDDQTVKNFTRAKPKVSQVSLTGTAAQNYIFKMLTDDEYGGASSSANISVGVGTGFYTEDVTVPYEMDNKLLSFSMKHDGACKAKIYGFAVDVRSRGY